ncbi:peptide-methionine (S)-S-oxide reductase [Flagellimonas taeanensis]|jgi:peptide-methionine (S)-S-oxide reductase|uniref:peptide-methionine (S)-S-oxide reductase MsrA n=1 Tax=Flavobacteriaceae TaxID=49546 RepID=UPI000E68D1E6|nr:MULTISPECIES: peptide-methionine (S)-S-oxide reductase MsrA [Allomuricauda]MDC6386171.1 peptide-methionine (S)-S-oxide reductase MsrA [Muricauda sp. SK9]MEE1963342.1 peptide-methionine (S)-S-oxide reductase MsrA [Allomuricauda taeanensis]RIV48146.1 peptide-methionine (S)-S-oxide reductase [Allomuricauda taeanensis]
MSEQKNNSVETAIFAGGCFWCTEAVFQRLNGVKDVVPGYTGGNIKNPAYREICTGRTGHAEAIKITFDPAQISYTELLEVFFATHDPTTLNRQGNDVGTQYRSEIFYTSQEQRYLAEEFIALLEKEGIFALPIVTAISEEKPFYLAEEEHHNYYNDHRQQPYCQFIIDPKIKKLNALLSQKST